MDLTPEDEIKKELSQECNENNSSPNSPSLEVHNEQSNEGVHGRKKAEEKENYSLIREEALGLRRREKVKYKEENNSDLEEIADILVGSRRPKRTKKLPPKPPSQKVPEESYPCPKCPMRFCSKTGVVNHLRIHVVEENNPRPFRCMLCDEECADNEELKHHKKVHDNDGATYKCTKCKMAFTNHMHWLRHNLRHQKPPYKCRECNRCYTARESMSVHIETHYDTGGECQQCHRTIKGEYAFQRHIKEHDMNISCGECGKMLNNTVSLRYHMISHTGVKLYQCLYCGKGFANDAQRKIHHRNHTNERPYKCEICQKTFTQSTNIERHLNTHSKLRQRYECDVCHKQYKVKHSLVTHRKVHTESAYSCNECEKKFATKQELRSHLLYNHVKEKFYKCEVCKFSFTMKGHLTRHLQSNRHKNNMFGAQRKKSKKQEKESETEEDDYFD